MFIAAGRLGNQLFQYSFLKSIQNNGEKIVTIGADDIEEVFNVEGVVNFNLRSRWGRHFIYRICEPVLSYLSDKKIISSVCVDIEKCDGGYTREKNSFTKKKGVLSRFCYVKRGFFQSDSFFDRGVISSLRIKQRFDIEAQDFLKLVPENSHKVCIHIRRGDYKDFSVLGKNTMLPMSYFRKQIDWFLTHREQVFFIFLGDDSEFVQKEFSGIKNKIISCDNHFGVDMAIMTCCHSAILSPSSFGWWGSYFIKKPDIVFVPRYWLGFNSRVEVQRNCIRKDMFKVEVGSINDAL